MASPWAISSDILSEDTPPSKSRGKQRNAGRKGPDAFIGASSLGRSARQLTVPEPRRKFPLPADAVVSQVSPLAAVEPIAERADEADDEPADERAAAPPRTALSSQQARERFPLPTTFPAERDGHAMPSGPRPPPVMDAEWAHDGGAGDGGE